MSRANTTAAGILTALALLAGCAGAPAVRVDVDADASSAQRAAETARSMVGRPYRAGGAHPRTGFDCSGLVQYSYRQAGVRLPRTTESLLASSKTVPRAELRRGDLVFFDQEGKKKSHVGIYLGGGRFVHAPSSGKRVRTDRLDSPYWKRHLSDLRRFWE